MKYTVVVGNVGTIYDGDKEWDAKYLYADAVYRSQLEFGRMAGENVILMKDSAILDEYTGTSYQDADLSGGQFSYADTPEGARTRR